MKNTSPSSTPTKNAKTSAITSYFTLIGFIIAFFMNLEEKHPFANFHLRQSLGLWTLFFSFASLLGIIPNNQTYFLAFNGFLICFFILWTYALVTALQNKTEPIPLVGRLFQKIFSFLK